MSEMGPGPRQESIMMITGTGDATRPASPQALDPSTPGVDVSTVTIGSSESDRASAWAWALVGPTTADRAGEASTSTKGGLVTLITSSQDSSYRQAGCVHCEACGNLKCCSSYRDVH